MYRSTYIDAAGRTRKTQGYFVLNKVNRARYGRNVCVQARDKVSAANKIQKLYKLPVTASNLIEVSMKLGKLYQEAMSLA